MLRPDTQLDSCLYAHEWLNRFLLSPTYVSLTLFVGREMHSPFFDILVRALPGAVELYLFGSAATWLLWRRSLTRRPEADADAPAGNYFQNLLVSQAGAVYNVSSEH